MEKEASKENGQQKFMELDIIDRKIVQLLQDEFPLAEEPWLELSNKLNISEPELVSRIKRLMEAGAVLKIGPIFDSSRIGLKAATLVAMRIPKNKVDQVAFLINQYDGNISHNYERDDEYNVWFTIAAQSTEELVERLDEIKLKTGVEENDILDLPTVQRFKINVRFQLT